MGCDDVITFLYILCAASCCRANPAKPLSYIFYARERMTSYQHRIYRRRSRPERWPRPLIEITSIYSQHGKTHTPHTPTNHSSAGHSLGQMQLTLFMFTFWKCPPMSAFNVMFAIVRSKLTSRYGDMSDFVTQKPVCRMYDELAASHRMAVQLNVQFAMKWWAIN